jgi:hypothetical protein
MVCKRGVCGAKEYKQEAVKKPPFEKDAGQLSKRIVLA